MNKDLKYMPIDDKAGTFMSKHCSPISYGTPLKKKSCSGINYGSPFKQDECAVAWDKLKKQYEAKGPNGLKEYNREKSEYYCDNGTVKLRPTDDADRP